MIHCFRLKEFNIVLDVHTGGVHLVDDITYEILENVTLPLDEKCKENIVQKLKCKYSQSELEECFDEIVELYNDGILFSNDDYEKFADYAVASPVKAMCLHIAHDAI